MHIKKLFFCLLTVMISYFANAQHSLDVKINGVKSDVGNICFAVYNEESSFLKLEKAYTFGMEKAVKGITNFKILNLPKGEYAIAIFHDANDNTILDTNFLGIPKENVAFSVGKMKTFGPPDYKDCTFALDANSAIEISLN